MLDIHWATGMDTRYPYPRKKYPRIPYYIHIRNRGYQNSPYPYLMDKYPRLFIHTHTHCHLYSCLITKLVLEKNRQQTELLPFTAFFPPAPKFVPGALRIASSVVFTIPRLLRLVSAEELTPFLPPSPAEPADGSAWPCPCERLLLASAAAMRWPSCGSGPDLVLIRLSPSEDARIGDSAAADAPPPPPPPAFL
jgi:hypothetical protein